ncbi:MAG: class I SAM-dependent methyltransferase [Elusimicrobiota bacterium]
MKQKFEQLIKKKYIPRYHLLSRNVQKIIYSLDLEDIDFTGKNVLDIGCGAGLYSIYLALIKNASKIVAVDEYLGHGNVASNKELFLDVVNNYGLKEKISIVQGDIFNLTFQDNSFDVVMLNDVMHHLYITNEDISELTQIPDSVFNLIKKYGLWLKPNGIVIIHEVKRRNILEILPRYFNRANIDFTTKQNPDGWTNLFEHAGFCLQDVKYYVSYKLKLYTPFLYKLLSAGFLSYFLRGRYRLIFGKRG